MNTKGTRFLAVVAVMALAFTVFVALEPADENMAVNVFDFDDDYVNPESVTSTTTWPAAYDGQFYISEDTTVKMKGVPATLPVGGCVFYVQNGVALTLDFKTGWTGSQVDITVVTVTGDQQFNLNGTDVGKIPMDSTQVVFKAVAGMSVYYQAAIIDYDVDYSRTTSGVNGGDFIRTVDPEVDTEAYFSADATFTAAPIFGTAEAGRDVAVAPGQTIVSKEAITNNTLTYGAIVVEPAGTYTEYTYYSEGADIGNVTLTQIENNKVEVKVAKVTVKTSDGTSVKIEKVKENSKDNSTTTVTLPVAPTDNAAGKLKLVGEFGLGTINISGVVEFDNTGIFKLNDGTATVANKSTVNGSIKVEGTLVLKNEDATHLNITGEGTLVASNTKLWPEVDRDIPTAPTDGIRAGVDDFKGLIDTSSITKVLRMEKDISSAFIEINQTFELFGDTTVSTALTVRGILIVDEGVTLTVGKGATITLADATPAANNANYAQIINYGTIVVKAEVFGEGLFVEAGKLTNYGTINMASKSNLGGDTTSTIYSAGLGIKNFGTISVSKSDYVDFNKNFENTATGTVKMNGKFINVSTFTNKGRIEFNGAELLESTAKVVIDNKSLNASVYFSSVILGTGAANTILIEDTAWSYYNADDEIHKGNSGVGISAEATTSTVRGLTVAATVDDDDNPQMVVKGGVTVSSNKQQVNIKLYAMNETNDTYEIADCGNFLVPSTFSIPAYVKLGYYNYTVAPDNAAAQAVKIVVDGEMSFNKDAIGYATNNGAYADTFATTKLYINGSIISKEQDILSRAQYVGAKVENADGDTLYLPLENAIDYAVLNDINNVDVGYVYNGVKATGVDDCDYVTVVEDIAIPAEMNVQTVSMQNSGVAKI